MPWARLQRGEEESGKEEAESERASARRLPRSWAAFVGRLPGHAQRTRAYFFLRLRLLLLEFCPSFLCPSLLLPNTPLSLSSSRTDTPTDPVTDLSLLPTAAPKPARPATSSV